MATPITFEEDESEDDSENCPDCGCHLFTENHDLDCAYDGEDDEDDDGD